MSESIEKSGGQPDMSRRKFLEKTAGGLAAVGMAAGDANAGATLRWMVGMEDKGELEDKFHAARKYMAHNGGELEKNFERLNREVGAKMVDGTYTRIPEKNRKVAQDKDMQPIFAERQEILARIDPRLIPELLVVYIQNDVTNKSLVKVYQELGGDIAEIKKSGLKGVDEHLVDEIMSEITYSIGSVPGRANYGLAEYNALSFKRRPAPTPTDIPLLRPQVKK